MSLLSTSRIDRAPSRAARHRHQRPPALQRRQIAVEGQRTRDLQQARRALRAINVPPQPEAMIGDARDHAISAWPACTQVSFDPPPWLELTTYDPARNAT